MHQFSFGYQRTWHGSSRDGGGAEHAHDDGSQLIVLPSEPPDLVEAGVQPLVGRIHAPCHLHVLPFLLLHDVAKQSLQLLVST